jgi:uncharacterized membrane protein
MGEMLGTRTIFVCPVDSRGAAEALDAEFGAWARGRRVEVQDVATAYRTPEGRLKLERDWDWWSVAAAAGGVILAPTIIGAVAAAAVVGGGTTLLRRKIGRRMSTNMLKRIGGQLDAGRALYLVAVKSEFDEVVRAWFAGRAVEAHEVGLDAAAEAEILEALRAPSPDAGFGPGGPVETRTAADRTRVAAGDQVVAPTTAPATWGEMFGTVPAPGAAEAAGAGEGEGGGADEGEDVDDGTGPASDPDMQDPSAG